MSEPHPTPVSRRSFVQATAAAAAAVGAGLALPGRLHAAAPAGAAPDVLRIGLVGCGGRGTGAAVDAMRGSERVELVAMGDLFPDRLETARTTLAALAAEQPAVAAKYKVTPERCFTGFDAYQQVIGAGVDLVILATPPGFRPAHLAAAVQAGKHVFTEKPVAVDAAGVRSVLATAALAKQKGLGVVAGTQRRHDPGYRATIERLHGGAIGEVLAGRVYWNQGGLWHAARKPEWTDTEWQIRNWLYFTWLSGDHVVEQHIHNIDVANWVLGAHPVRAAGAGGRQQRTDEKFGHVYDHFAVELEYPGGVRVLSMCRPDRRHRAARGRVLRRDARARRAARGDRGAARVAVRGADAGGQPVRAGAHRPRGRHPRRAPAQRAAAGGRDHAVGDHGARGGVHRADGDRGRPRWPRRRPSGRRRRRSARCRCSRWRCPG
jgi:predicted dehydrogenase